MTKSDYIMQSNMVTLSKISLTNVYEKRLLNAFVDSLSPHLKGKFEEAKGLTPGIHVKEQIVNDVCKNETIIYTYRLADVEPNDQNYDRLRAAIEKLRQTNVRIITPDRTEIFTGLIQYAEIDFNSEFFRASISLTAYQFLSDLSKGYSLKHFKTSLELKGLYASHMYDLLCKWRNVPAFQIDIEELRFITNAPDSYSNNDFKKRVLEPAKKELDNSNFADISFNYEHIKTGRSITGFKFYVIHTENDKLITNKLTKQVSVKWDLDKTTIQYLELLGINYDGKNRELLKKFFNVKGRENGIELIQRMANTAKMKSETNPQGYIRRLIEADVEKMD